MDPGEDCANVAMLQIKTALEKVARLVHIRFRKVIVVTPRWGKMPFS
ncbi:hypothetical protein ACPOL_5229 [Acidisarcina polymorpha]|uniref:Uncharacterized protein n=1 Tax=Acidisarcina polymorpha TaxID=2211140 RepID=A0A2Z5G5H8_9BACT|nr:hypothetical protein ACPOL_5229 [Acidisarcina polymorpha]